MDYLSDRDRKNERRQKSCFRLGHRQVIEAHRRSKL